MPAPYDARSRVPLVIGLVLLVPIAFVTATPDLGDSSRNLVYALVNSVAALVGLIGARRRSGPERRVALLVAAGLVLSALGDIAYAADAAGRSVPDASPADAFYLPSVAALGCALFLAATQGHGHRRDMDAVIDASSIVVVSALVLWDVQLRTLADQEGGLGPIVLTAYPVLDAMALGLLLRVAFGGRSHAWGGWWLVAGLGAWLTSDLLVLFGVVSDLDDRVSNLGWMLGSVLMAQSTWPPRPEADRADPVRRTTVGRVMVAILPLSVPPGLLLLDQDRGDGARVVVLVATAVLLALAVMRTLRLVRSEARARDAAVAASRAKSDFLAMMSHEIRTPMNGVLGLTSLLLASDLDDRQRRYAEGVQSTGLDLMTIINDLLDFSKIEAGRIDITSHELDVCSLLTDVAAIVVDPRRSNDVRTRVLCDVPPVMGDVAHLRQVLLNLAANAVKFTPRGEVVLSAAEVAHEGDHVRVRFEVRDDGIGITPEDLSRVFEPFAQADASTTREFGGTGLGLTISRQLVTAMGGTLRAASTPGEGSRFWFDLDLEPVEVPPDPVPTRVLVVEDDEVNQLVAEGIVEHLGHLVVTDAIEPHDLVLADARLATSYAGDAPVVEVDRPLRPADLASRIDEVLGQRAT